jgi:protein-disulfide isomerase
MDWNGAGNGAPPWPKRHRRARLREIIGTVLSAGKRSRSIVLMLSVLLLSGAALSRRTQIAAFAAGQAGLPGTGAEAGGKLSPELARRIEVMIRARSEVPPQYVISIGDRKKSEISGYDQVTVTFSADGNTSKPLTFLISTDGKTLAQFNKFDISADPKDKVSGAGRPARGGPENAPVLVVGFDDLECPYCAKMHAAMFPAILERYKNQVHVVYLDFPLTEIHPWAMRAAVDANCLAAASPTGYWNFVDNVHAHAADFGGSDHSVAKANGELDKLTEDEGARQKVNAADLEACVKKQDDTKIKAAVKLGESLGVGGTPALFINGLKVDGVTSMEDIYRIIDGALTAAGQTPPPPFKAPPAQPAVSPSPAAPPSPAATPTPAAKPGN